MYAQGQAYSYASTFNIPPINAGVLPIPTSIPVVQSLPTLTAPSQPTRISAGFGKDRLSNDTSSKDPELLKARIFIGNLNSAQCTRNDLIDLCQPYGKLKALSLLKGYAFVQYETQSEAEMAIKILSGYNFFNQKLDVRLAAMGKGSFTSSNSNLGPVRRPKHDFLFGGQRIRVETTNVRNRTFAQDVFGVLKEINFHNHGRDDTIICGTCRTVCNNIKIYIEHRRQKKCNFFEREVAPSTVSCFTCKEEFGEPWLFIQHLIHRHSINLYRGQPDSDSVAYLEKIKNKNEPEGKTEESKTSGEANTVETQSAPSHDNQEQRPPAAGEAQSLPSATVEANGIEICPEISNDLITQEKSSNNRTEKTDTKTIKVEKTGNDNASGQQSVSEKSGERRMSVDSTLNRQKNDGEEVIPEDLPSYSSAISIGVSPKIIPSVMPASTLYVPSVASVPSFHSQMSTMFRPQHASPQIPAYQFTQPISNTPVQPAYSNYGSKYAPTAGMPSSVYQSVPSSTQISLTDFTAQSSTLMSNQGGLSEEEQMRLLQEFDMDKS